jgi:hypothetical protein
MECHPSVFRQPRPCEHPHFPTFPSLGNTASNSFPLFPLCAGTACFNPSSKEIPVDALFLSPPIPPGLFFGPLHPSSFETLVHSTQIRSGHPKEPDWDRGVRSFACPIAPHVPCPPCPRFRCPALFKFSRPMPPPAIGGFAPGLLVGGDQVKAVMHRELKDSGYCNATRARTRDMFPAAQCTGWRAIHMPARATSANGQQQQCAIEICRGGEVLEASIRAPSRTNWLHLHEATAAISQ